MATNEQLINMVDKVDDQGLKTVSKKIARDVLGKELDENTLIEAINQANTVLDDKRWLVQEMVEHAKKYSSYPNETMITKVFKLKEEEQKDEMEEQEDEKTRRRLLEYKDYQYIINASIKDLEKKYKTAVEQVRAYCDQRDNEALKLKMIETLLEQGQIERYLILRLATNNENNLVQALSSLIIDEKPVIDEKPGRIGKNKKNVIFVDKVIELLKENGDFVDKNRVQTILETGIEPGLLEEVRLDADSVNYNWFSVPWILLILSAATLAVAFLVFHPVSIPALVMAGFFFAASIGAFMINSKQINIERKSNQLKPVKPAKPAKYIDPLMNKLIILELTNKLDKLDNYPIVKEEMAFLYKSLNNPKDRPSLLSNIKIKLKDHSSVQKYLIHQTLDHALANQYGMDVYKDIFTDFPQESQSWLKNKIYCTIVQLDAILFPKEEKGLSSSLFQAEVTGDSIQLIKAAITSVYNDEIISQDSIQKLDEHTQGILENFEKLYQQYPEEVNEVLSSKEVPSSIKAFMKDLKSSESNERTSLI